MMHSYEFLIKSAILVLLPLIPAVLIFLIFPNSEATGRGPIDVGPFGKMQWKLGGAFAAYVVVAIYLVTSSQIVITSDEDTEVWTIRGRVEASGLGEVSQNVLNIRTQPSQLLEVAPDGAFELDVVVKRDGGSVRFPRLVFDMTGVCFGAKTVALDGSAETFLSSTSELTPKLKRNNGGREIEFVTPVVMQHVTGASHGPCSG